MNPTVRVVTTDDGSQLLRGPNYVNAGFITSTTFYLPVLHESPWSQPVVITSRITLTKLAGKLRELRTEDRFHLIYYDAFAQS